MDLAHLLRRFGLGVEFLTVTLGANPAYARERFYRAHLHEDCARVTRLFEVPPIPYGACPKVLGFFVCGILAWAACSACF